MEFELVEEVFMERDFKDRTVLSIICANDVKPFIVKSKLRFLLNKIWDGKDSNLIDGKTSHFSKTRYLLSHEPRQLAGAKVELSDIIGSNFKRQTTDFNFEFQLKFRKQSIQLIYIKDFFCASLLILMFQYINYLYLSLFKEKAYDMMDTLEEQRAIILKNLQTYKSINFAGILLSLSYIISLVCRLIFNIFAKVKLPIDLWMIFDITTGVINIGAFIIIGNASVDSILNQNNKRFLDYYIIVILIFSWIRFFSYFLVIEGIGKITITLLRMIQETGYFLFIVVSYFLLMSTIFTTLFRNTNSMDTQAEDFSTFFLTLRQLFNYTTGNYGLIDMGNYAKSYQVLYIVHTVISNIFLLNYLVAILQTAQLIMFQNGDFYSIQYQYFFISKYLLALEEKNGYDELILLPPPLNYLLIPLIIISPSKVLMKKASHIFKLMIFWIENIFLILGYLLYFFALSPYIYMKKIFLIMIKLQGFCNKFIYTFLWIFFGFFYLIYTNLADTGVLIQILCLQQTDSNDVSAEEKKRLDLYSLVIYKDLDSALRQLNEIAENNVDLLKKRNSMQSLMKKKLTLQQRLKQANQNQEEGSAEDVFSVSKNLVIEVYKEISVNNSITKYYRTQLQKKSIASNLNQFMTLKSFSTDLGHKYQPSMLSQEFVDKVGEYFTNNEKEKDLALFYEIFYGDETVRRHQLQTRAGRIPKDEFDIISRFLDKFLIQKKGQNSVDIDLDLAIKVLPKRLTMQNLHKIDLINFTNMQKSLIQFYHNDQDEMFTYYDDRLKSRLTSLRRKSTRNHDSLKSVYGVIQTVFDYMSWDEFTKATKIINHESENTFDNLNNATIIENKEMLESAIMDEIIEKEIIERSKFKSKIKRDPQFAPPSFQQRTQANELPFLPDFQEDSTVIKQYTRTKTITHPHSHRIELSQREPLQRQLSKNMIPNNQRSAFNQEYLDQNQKQSLNSGSLRQQARQAEAKRKKLEDKNTKTKKEKEVRVFEQESQASSDINEFNYDNLRQPQNSSILSPKQDQLGKEIDFSEYSDNQ